MARLESVVRDPPIFRGEGELQVLLRVAQVYTLGCVRARNEQADDSQDDDASGRGLSRCIPPRRARRGGRPSQEEALRRDARLVEIAAALFMERGFDATTIDAVAEAASVGKATLYARYRDKAALFAAVFRRQIDRWLSVSAPEAPEPGDRAADVLLSMGRRMAVAVLAPEAVAINRIVAAQAARFPELAQMVHREGWQRSNTSVAAVLDHFVRDGQIAVEDVELAADLFLSLVVGRLSRLAMLGIAVEPEQVERRTTAAVRLFLDGAAPRP